MRSIKGKVKHIIYGSGALAAYRRLRPETLTSVMFHRVLPLDDPRAKAADPAYTMRLDTFEDCLDALREWYQPVSIENVRDALHERTALPRNALLITFDDGWEDTARYAVPALRARGMPCLIFVATGAVGKEDVPWRDVVACVWRAGTLTAPPGYHAGKTLDGLLDWLESLPLEERTRTLKAAIEAAGDLVRPFMISPGTLRRLAEDGVGLGGHGACHVPLTKLADVGQELRQCWSEFESLTGRVPTSFAFPHGVYSGPILETTQRAGYELIFTSDRHLNPLRHGHPISPIFGRISMSEDDVTDSAGRFCREKLAYWLSLQPIADFT